MGFGLHGSQFTKTGDPMTASFFISCSFLSLFPAFSSPF
jgi:hypothetical protein